MLIRKIRNKYYSYLKNRRLKHSFIDVNASVDKECLIEGSELHGKVSVGQKCKIHQCLISGNVKIGRFTSLWGPNIQVLSNKHPITIGNFCSIARDVTIQEYFHDHSRMTTYYINRNLFGNRDNTELVSKGPIEIGNDVWIGTGVQIMSGVKIGNGVVVAANSTVTKDIPSYAIVGGVPAKILKHRFDTDKIKELEEMKWWDWSVEKIKKNRVIFDK
jgi:acetyltransferase-like isoleucine patch superfamily enzyme